MSNASQNAQRRIVEKYYETTSRSGSSVSVEQLRVALLSLRRRLGGWAPHEGQSVLDLGSGTGELCALAIEAAALRVVGVNLSMGEIDVARERSVAEFVCADIGEYLDSCRDAEFDRVYALNLLEHLDKDALLRVLAGAFRTLKPGGDLIAVVPNATSPFGAMTRYWDITHCLAFTPSSVVQLGRMVGFETYEFRECGPVPHGFISGIRYLLWQCVRSMIAARLMIELASTKGGIYTADMMFRLCKSTGGA